MNKFNVGDKVLFCYCYGDGLSIKRYEYGKIRKGTINDMEYIEARNTYLYEVSYLTKFDNPRVSYRLLNERWIFNLNEKDKALELLKNLCDHVKSEE